MVKNYNTAFSIYFTDEIVDDFNKLTPLYVCTDDVFLYGYKKSGTRSHEQVVVFWASYEDKLIYCVTDRIMGDFESMFDWDIYKDGQKVYFDFIEPGKPELDFLSQFSCHYYLFDPKILDILLDNFCQLELDMISRWTRENKINKLLS